MPFKFGVRKACRYAVSKHSLVVCVHVLDHQLMDCILTYDSIGRECLESITSRIGISDSQYFGLRYIDRRRQYRWIDLDKPLKKQLDKSAPQAKLYFGIMFHVLDGLTIQDMEALYYYYLLLRSDVNEGRLGCNVEQAVLLSAYALQVELGDYDPVRHDVNFLNSCDFLPKTLISDGQLLQELVIMHQRLRGIAQITAQLQFIQEAQQLDGYGLEFYPVKDMPGKELLIGISLVGIYVKANNEQPTVCFKWNDVIGFQRNKKVFGIETTLSEKPFCYLLDDADSAKYLFTVCNLQMSFYKSQVTQQLESLTKDDRRLQINDSQHSTLTTDNSQQAVDSSGDQTVIIHDSDSPHNASDQQLAVNLPASAERLAIGQESVHTSDSRLQATHPVISNVDNFLANAAGAGYNLSDPHQGERTFMQQSSQLSSSSAGTAAGFGLSQEALYHYRLPSYRPTPDYDTVMKMRALAHSQQQAHSIGGPSQDVLLSYSQPDIYQAAPRASTYHLNPTVFHADSGCGSMQYGGKPVDRSSSLVVRPLTSGPSGVVRHSSAVNAATHNVGGPTYVYYRSPPPYPRQSNSTPELASPPMQHGTAVSYSRDLVTHPAAPNSVLATQSRYDKSIDNLTVDVNQLHIRHGTMIDALLASNLQQTGVGYSRPDVNGNNGYQVEVTRSTLNGSYTPVAVNQDLMHAQYGRDFAASDVTSRYVSPQVFQSQLPNGRDGSGRSAKAMNNQYVNVDRSSRELFLSDAAQYEYESMVRGLAVGPSASGLVSNAAGSSGSIASSSSFSARLAGGGLRGDSSTQCYVTSANEVVQGYTVLKPSSSSNSMNDNQRMYTVIDDEPANGFNRIIESASPRDERRQVLESKMESQLFAEFEMIAKKRHRCECGIATLERNRERNRFNDVVPYDDNRVQLVPTRLNPDGYINASHIRASVADDNYWYIAAQGPLSNTVGDFWQMIWQYGIVVIAMLTSCDGPSEYEKSKCARYWPEKLGHQNSINVDEYEITVQCTSDSKPCVTSGLLVRHNPSGKQRVVWHLQFADWPDHGCPDNHYSFLDYLGEIEAIRNQVVHPMFDHMQSYDFTSPAPVLVHCSAGVGRTGVVILTQVMKALLEHNQVADVPAVLRLIRDQRMFMVQTVTQYSYVYKTLVSYLQSSRLI